VARSFKTVISIDDLAAASSEALRTKVVGDSNARISVDAGGKVTWGTGSAAGDVNLYRSAANALKTDDSFQATGGLITETVSGTPTGTPADGSLLVDTANNKFYFRSSSGWRSGGVSETSADGGTAVSQVRYHVNADGGANGASA
jgi:hypothetical protein